MTRAAGRFAVRHLCVGDLPAVLAIQSWAYPAFLRESESAFASRLALPQSYCLGATSDGALVGYLIAHGWPSQAPPTVGAVLDPTENSDVLFIHDLAVSPAGQGSGIGRALFDHALEMAARDGLARAELIAVEGADSYWRALGFAKAAMSPHLAAKVAAYGPRARWMVRDIAASRSQT